MNRGESSRGPAAWNRQQLAVAAGRYASTARHLGLDLDAAISRLRAEWI